MNCVSTDRCEDTIDCWLSICKADFVRILYFVPRYEITLFHFAVVQCSSFCENSVLRHTQRTHYFSFAYNLL
jgi:hypothetical protein